MIMVKTITKEMIKRSNKSPKSKKSPKRKKYSFIGGYDANKHYSQFLNNKGNILHRIQ